MSSINSTQPSFNEIAALSGSEAVVNLHNIERKNNKNHILRINKHGQFVQKLYKCEECVIGGLLVLGDSLYIVHHSHKIVKVNLITNEIVQEYKMDEGLYVVNRGPLYFDPDLIPDKDLLILYGYSHQEVFTYRLSTQMKESSIKIGMQTTRSITYSFYNN